MANEAPTSGQPRFVHLTDIRFLVKEYAKTLDDKDKDEWYTTNRDIWEQMSKDFISWLNSNTQHKNVLVTRGKKA